MSKNLLYRNGTWLTNLSRSCSEDLHSLYYSGTWLTNLSGSWAGDLRKKVDQTPQQEPNTGIEAAEQYHSVIHSKNPMTTKLINATQYYQLISCEEKGKPTIINCNGHMPSSASDVADALDNMVKELSDKSERDDIVAVSMDLNLNIAQPDGKPNDKNIDLSIITPFEGNTADITKYSGVTPDGETCADITK